uniref:Uncharacterized protein n=1 Tax=Rhizophora mucronata TaxID=61149 RepID=A0A2P2PYR8_RHIMU
MIIRFGPLLKKPSIPTTGKKHYACPIKVP